MILLGENRSDLPFQACNKFYPIVLEGNLCYSLNLSSIRTEKSKAGENAALMIFIDQGTANKNIEQDGSSPGIDDKFYHLELKASEDVASSVRINLNLLSSFSDHRAGSYAMSSLKKITGTESFLGQTEEKKKCMLETREDCQNKIYMANVQEKCGCFPWSLTRALNTQVI